MDKKQARIIALKITKALINQEVGCPVVIGHSGKCWADEWEDGDIKKIADALNDLYWMLDDKQARSDK